ncbi:AcrR family transcriptional regulator [Kineosphaera limosa]|uniref:Putative TetR family transcriptional regulator n=1 Tax=Kineosphaera limosa NBRC 100340 TaxID=1184609 RepID=K6WRV0_9MICO|nr:TetR/AcrR family transcriptional regulator [Kineosphaera limosa]NYE01228.1 AcrR family transcriptional regulator [Kineosphaera limosa]GAB96571.1 putative TetR family transcriptional regulator [Kineosphaera limosa NBRC 100340]
MPPRPPGRPPLDRATVLAAAVQLADAEGVDAISMRHLADALDVVPMALYKHVGGKDDLLDGMVEAVLREIPGQAREGDWKAQVRAAILAARRAIGEHPWARRAIETRTVRSPAVLAHMECLVQHFLRGGLSVDLTHHVMHALGNRIWGFSPELFPEGSPAPDGARRTTASPDPGDYPGILAISADARARRPGASACDEDYEFTFALDLMLDAVERLHTAGWSSGPTRL